MEKETDYRDGHKVIATIELEDHGQDFLELDVLDNGVLLGYSMMFSHGRLSLLGIGSENGTTYHNFQALKDLKTFIGQKFAGLTVYMHETGEKEPVPWEAPTLKYKVVRVKNAEKPNRFIK